MSMRDYPVFDYGILLTEDEAELFDDLENPKTLNCFSDFCGFFTPFDKNKKLDYEKEFLIDNFWFYLLAKGPDLFSGPAYGSLEEIQTEFLNAVGRPLPEGFSLEGKIGRLEGTVYC